MADIMKLFSLQFHVMSGSARRVMKIYLSVQYVMMDMNWIH